MRELFLILTDSALSECARASFWRTASPLC